MSMEKAENIKAENLSLRKSENDLSGFDTRIDTARSEEKHSDAEYDLDKRTEVSEPEKQPGNNETYDPDKRISLPYAENTDVNTPNAVSAEPRTFGSRLEMKLELGKTYGEIDEAKPLYSPDLSRWFAIGGILTILESNFGSIWTYTDSEGRSVSYIDGNIVFPPESKHPVIGDISIGAFTGDREKDKQLYLEKLEDEYGLTAIPEGYELHHDTKNGTLQLVRADYHSKFGHEGGHSMYKEDA